MDISFWIERWNNNQIGFHQREINPYLQRHWSALGVTRGTVFVPLCGKSHDMVWLHAQGHDIIGVEVSRQAISEFFAEQHIEPQITQALRFEVWQAPGYRLLCGDFFALEAMDLQSVSAVFDRAALIALPYELRERYVETLQSVLPAQARMLLVSLTYAQQQMNGPPFSVPDAEVKQLYATYRIDKLHDQEVIELDENARLKARGVTQMSEQVYQLQAC